MGRKRFIDKKNSVTFHLLHRSQRDPLAADETAPQRVLAEAEPSLEASGDLSQRQLNAKYGIFFDDDYNYLQHLKSAQKDNVVWVQEEPEQKRRRHRGQEPVEAAAPTASASVDVDADSDSDGEMPALQLPSSVFASTREEKVGLLNKAAPDHGLPTEAEAELAEVMADDYEPDDGDELEDNFIELAGGACSDVEGEDSDDCIEVEVDSDVADDGSDDFDENDDAFDGPLKSGDRPTKSVFTEYSTTSQGVLSTVAMEALNERFENFMGQYEDLEVGALETEEISGTLDPSSNQLMSLVRDFEKSKQKPTIEKELTLKETEDKSEDEDLVYLTVYEKCSREDRMDCESILSTYSNTRNRPAVIDTPSAPGKIKIGRGGIAKDDRPRLTRRALAQLESAQQREEQGSDSDAAASSDSADSSAGRETLVSRISALSFRPQGELPADRRARKHELKALRRERIQEKKANRMLTKIMAERQAQSQADKQANKEKILYS